VVEPLFAPWRLAYVTSVDERDRSECIFCRAFRSADDAASLTLWRDERSFTLLNRFPYTTGHSMVAPISHCGDLQALDRETLAELMDGARRLVGLLRELYRPHAFNIGFNLGEAAGAGVEEHLHLHVVPRWRGDTSFITVVGGVRVIPEDLETTFERIRSMLTQRGGG
jgi:ATP adenylyltransferase